jgi:GLPGLI family protein
MKIITELDNLKMKTQGKMVYTLEYTNLRIVRNYDDSEPPERRYCFKGNYKRIESFFNKDKHEIMLFDKRSKYQTMMFISKGKKFARIIEFGLYNEKEKDISVTPYRYTGETKIICGYKCFKAEYDMPQYGMQFYVYYTTEFKAPLSALLLLQFNGLKGFPIEYNGSNGDNKYIYSMSEISFDDVDDCLFEIPKDYKIIYDERNKK